MATKAKRLTTVHVGQRVYWHDPDRSVGSGSGTVVSIGLVEPDDPIDEETIIALKMDSGSEAEVFVHELSALPETR